MKTVYGFLLLVLVVAVCFGYQVYLISQLQSQIKTVQDTENARSQVIVLGYSWTDQPFIGGSPAGNYMVSVNCTLLNASSNPSNSPTIRIHAQFGTHMETSAWTEDTMYPWQTRNYYDLVLIYDKAERGNPDAVWLSIDYMVYS
jgi:hypothetical protein